MNSILTGKSVLVTGGTGSIGETIVKRALKDGAKKIRVFSNDENGLYEIEQQFEGNKKLEYIIGDIRDEDIVESIVKNTDLVFHAAALKHVDRCELNPFEAITVNTIGTKNLIKAALKENVKKVVAISTDKAVNPIGVMGATKLLAEKLMAAEAYSHNSGTIFTTVRFGNVIQSRGSILPKIEKQIKQGGPITLTDSRMMRFFMTKDEAVDLILSAAKLAKGGETFVLKMPLVRLQDLFESMSAVLAPKYGYKPFQIKTKIIGIRSGEKLVEYLLNDYEMENVLETKDFFIIPPISNGKSKKYPGAKKPKDIHSYFKRLQPLSKKQIIKMLQKAYD